MIIELLHDDAQPPRRATAGSAGYDLCAYLRQRTVRCSDATRTWDVEPTAEGGEIVLVLEPGQMALVPLGFKARLPHGVEAQVRPRSGASFKKGLQIPNAPGTVDSDYPEEWMVIVRNGAPTSIRISHGERIAQMVLARFEIADIEFGTVGITTDRVGGFGSTGA